MTPSRDDYLNVAAQIGAQLCRDAIWSQSRCTWLGSARDPRHGVVERACGPDLYGGTAGIALFLARLYAATQERAFRTAAIGAFNHAWSRRDSIAPAMRLAFYSGWLGLAHVRIVLAKQLDRDDVCGQTIDMLETLAQCDAGSFAPDVITGSAGAIPLLLRLSQEFARPRLLELAIRQGADLLQRARPRGEGASSWRTLDNETRDDLTGFSHGAAGIASALLELHRVTGDERWRRAAEAGLHYEQSWFDARVQNWADLRIFAGLTVSPETPICSTTWCHGAPGIALSRLRAWKILEDDDYRRHAEVALDTTMRALENPHPTLVDDFSLCHGETGRADILLSAGRALDGEGADRYAATVERVAERGVQRYHAQRAAWPCGVHEGGETPSLMLGLAGIGYFYLRLCDPDTVPSVLFT